MDIKDQVTPEDWKLLVVAPFTAALYVTMASGGTLELAREMFSVGALADEQAKGANGASYGRLVEAVLAEFSQLGPEDVLGVLTRIRVRNREGMRAQARQLVVNASEVAEALPDADGYRKWIVDVARRAAETSRGGVLGLGRNGRPVDDVEQAALKTLANLLGLWI